MPVLAIHGGAGTISRERISPALTEAFTGALRDILAAGRDALQKGASALDAVVLAVTMFEDSPLFNAGRGSVYTRQETHEMDASVMNGANLAAGAVACVHGVKNPVLAARAVMEHSRHVLLAGEGAMDFLRQQGLAFAPESYFHTEHRLAQLRDARHRDAFGLEPDHDGAPDGFPPLDERDKMGTVGAVALDARGDLAAATSTGGMTNKLAGRVGDSPIIGAGCYADRTAAVSCTGVGEYFMRLTVARDVAARMQYMGLSLREAGSQTLDALTALGGEGGFIAVDRRGEIILPFNSNGMYRGWVGPDQKRHVAIYADPPKPD
jgi:beta-aspartyl-peptidase (threonine type)